MPTDIIDNRERKLADLLRQLLPDARAAHFASGYFFLSGFEQVAGHLDHLERFRLLIGQSSNRQTVEQIAEGYARRDVAAEAIRRDEFLTPAEKAGRARRAQGEIAGEIEAVEQSDAGEKLLCDLRNLIASGRLEVRVYTKARLHAKAYIFDYSDAKRSYKTEGIAVVGSSNFTLSGVRDNTELNVVVHDNGGNHADLTAWFDGLWEQAQPFDAALMEELSQSWAAQIPTPWQIYIKSLVALVGDRLDGAAGPEVGTGTAIEAQLTDFQRDAVVLAERYLEKWGGCFVSDVVGLGKSFIGAAIVKRAQLLHRARPLIICPKPLQAMWERYNEEFELDARVVPMSVLREEGGVNLDDYAARNFVLIDESHNFRNSSTQRYQALDDFLSDGDKKVCLLSATPLNASAWDVYHQLKLFHREDITRFGIDPPSLKEFFGRVERGEARLTALLPQILIRRRRQDVLRLYGFAGDSDVPLKSLDEVEVAPYLRFQKPAYVLVGGQKQGFPKRNLQTWRYSIEETYDGLYEKIRRTLGEAPKKNEDGTISKPRKHELTYARYGLLNYLPKGTRKQTKFEALSRSGFALRGLIRILLFKRLESSVYAFGKTLERMIASQKLFLRALTENNVVAAGDDSQSILRLADGDNEAELWKRLGEVKGGYDAKDFSEGDLKGDIERDIALLEELLALVKPIGSGQDAKLQLFLQHMTGDLVGSKVLVFTQYVDTAKYIFESVKAADTAMVASGDNKGELVARFAPRANAELWKKCRSAGELRVLVATDVLAEGLNLQDGDIIVNYDLHWNPVRLIQRFGRIDRIGSTHDQIWGYNFLPETNLEKNLNIEAVLKARIADIHATLGEDAAILHPDEALSEDAMRAIYTGEGDGSAGGIGLFDDAGQRDELAFLNEAEVLLRRLRDEEPQVWRTILELRGGVRSAKVGIGNAGKKIVVCRSGDWVQLYLCDATGKILTRDPSVILPLLESARELNAPDAIPVGHNAAVSAVLRDFEREVKMRRAARQNTRRASGAQKWVSERLQELFRLSPDNVALREQLPIIEKALRADGLPGAARRELNRLHKRKVAGLELWQAAVGLYYSHDLKHRPTAAPVEDEWPKIVCSLALE